jgi:hypothetical protein
VLCLFTIATNSLAFAIALAFACESADEQSDVPVDGFGASGVEASPHLVV